MNKKKLILLYIWVLTVLLTGCWDKIEIDERAFITGMGFDKYEEKEEEKKSDKEGEISGKDRYILTVTFPNVSMIAGKEEGDPSYIYSTVCSSPSDGKQEINLRNNKNFYLTHAKVVVLGEELAKDERLMREILDVIQRNVYINRKVHFMISKGKAQEILFTDSGKNMDIGLFIEELMEKELRSPRRPLTSFDNIIKRLRESDAAIVPRIIKGKKELVVSGAAILKGNKLAGWLDEVETRSANILLDQIGQADYTVKVGNLYLIVEQRNAKTEMRVYEGENGKINIDFKIRIEAVIHGHYYEVPDKPFNAEYIKKVNEEVARELAMQLKKGFEKIQKEYKADIFGVGEYLRKHEPDTWEKVKNNWGEIYPKAEVNIDLDMKIRRVGIEG